MELPIIEPKKTVFSRVEIQEIAETLDHKLSYLEKEDHVFDRGQILIQIYPLQQNLEQHYRGKKFNNVSQNQIRLLDKFHQRIKRQENILLQEGQDLVLEIHLIRFKQTLIAIQNEEYFQQQDFEAMKTQSERLEKQIKFCLKYVKNEKLLQKANKYLDIAQQKQQLESESDDSPEKLKHKVKLLEQFSQSYHHQLLKSYQTDTITYETTSEEYESLDEDPSSQNSEEYYIPSGYKESQTELQSLPHTKSYQNPPFISSFNENHIENQQQQQIQQQLKFETFQDEEIEEEKSQKITQLLYETQELNNMQQDIAELVLQDSEKLENLNKELEDTFHKTKNANTQMKQAYVQSQKTRRQKIKAFFLSIGGIIGLGAGGGVGAAVGGVGGAVVGKGIGKAFTDTKYEDGKDDD